MQKALQRQVYTFLSSRTNALVLVIGVCSIIVCALMFGEAAMEWSVAKYQAKFNAFSDNLKGVSYQERLCLPMPIDIVYTWVNGTDPRLVESLKKVKARLDLEEAIAINATRAAKAAEELRRHNGSIPVPSATPIPTPTASLVPTPVISSGIICKNKTLENSTVISECHNATLPDSSVPAEDESVSASRFQDNEELRYSLRSVERHAPWVRNIYIVTNNQIPSWLNLDNPRMHLVSHEDIFSNHSHLPSFSSPAIESHLHKIEGLSNKFIYLNDDVMFGRDIWPDDFYTHANGQKVYLSWPVPNCAEGCPSSWIGDKYCDAACNTSYCDYDGGDCLGKTAESSSRYNSWQSTQSHTSDQSHQCANGCPDSWVGDRYCDKACNLKACGFDGGDCGPPALLALHHYQTVSEGATYDIPDGEPATFFNLTATVGTNEIASGSHTNHAIVRTATLSQRFKTMVLTFHRNVTREPVLLTFIYKNNGTDIPVSFNITAYTVEKPEGETTASTVVSSTSVNNVTLANGTTPDGNVTMTLQNGTDFLHSTEEMRRQNEADMIFKRETKLNATLEELFEELQLHTPLSVGAWEAIEALKTDYRAGDITLKGFKKRVVKTLAIAQANATVGMLQAGLSPNSLSVTTITNDQVTSGSHHTPDLLGRKLLALSLDEDETETEEEAAEREKLKAHQAVVEEHFQNGLAAANLRTEVADWIRNSKEKQLRLKDDLAEAIARWEDRHGSWDPKMAQNVGSLPWEKLGLFPTDPAILDRITEVLRVLNDTLTTGGLVENDDDLSIEVPSSAVIHRRLMDTFGDSLKFVNRLYTKHFGPAARKVPAHIPHMIDKHIMFELQAKFPAEYEGTSSHQLRHGNDMQFAFAYFYYLISAPTDFDFDAVFSEFDTNESGILSANEVRSLAAALYDIPLDEKLNHLSHVLYNCTTNVTDGDPNSPLYRAVTKDVIRNCPEIMQSLQKRKLYKYKHEIMDGEGKDVGFKMVRDDVVQVMKQLDNLRKERPKFICLNDNIDHRKPSARQVVAALREYYEAMFPKPSQFELPPNLRNRFLYTNELREWTWQQYRTQILLDLLFVGLVVALLLMCFSNQVRHFCDRIARWRERALREKRSRKLLTV